VGLQVSVSKGCRGCRGAWKTLGYHCVTAKLVPQRADDCGEVQGTAIVGSNRYELHMNRQCFVAFIGAPRVSSPFAPGAETTRNWAQKLQWTAKRLQETARPAYFCMTKWMHRVALYPRELSSVFATWILDRHNTDVSKCVFPWT